MFFKCVACDKDVFHEPYIRIINGIEVEEDLCDECLKVVQDDLGTTFYGYDELDCQIEED